MGGLRWFHAAREGGAVTPEEKRYEALCARLEAALRGDPPPPSGTGPFLPVRARELTQRLERRLRELERARSEAEQNLGDTAAFYDSVFENLPDMVFVKDADDLRFIKINRAAERIMGHTRQEMLGRTDHDFFPPDQARFFQRKDREVLDADGVVDIPREPISTPEGERILHTRKVTIPDRETGAPRYLLGISSDITEQVEAERALRTAQQIEAELRAEKELNQRILECVPGGVVHVTPDGRIQSANERALAMLGLSQEALLAREVLDFGGTTVFEDGSTCRVEDYPVSRALASGQPQGPVTLGVVRPDGETTWGIYSAIPTFEPNGAVSGAVVTMLDITERKRSEEERLKLESGLWQAQKLESLGLLSSGIAHDFNNLLVAIIGNAGLALLELPEHTPVRDTVRQIDLAARRAADLTRQLLVYSGKGQLQVEPVDLGALVGEMRGLLDFSIPKHVRYVNEVEEELPLVRGDPAQLRQVFMNLITNAAESIDPARGGQVVVRTERRELGVDFLSRARGVRELEPGPYVCVEVRDTGRGMAERTAARMFDPFFSTKRSGRGLGLAAVLGIVQRHGGAIRVRSASGWGTSIVVALPAAADASLPAHDAEESGGLAAPAGVLLVVDDDPAVRDISRKTLTRKGYVVETAEDGQRAIELFDRCGGAVEAVLLDLTMPRMDGARTLNALRERAPDLPVLMTTGFSREEAQRALGPLRIDAFLPKPWGPRELLAAVRELLRS